MTTLTNSSLDIAEEAPSDLDGSILPLSPFTWCPVLVYNNLSKSPQVLLRETLAPYTCRGFCLPTLGVCAKGANMMVSEATVGNIEVLSLVGWRAELVRSNTHHSIEFTRMMSRMLLKIRVDGDFELEEVTGYQVYNLSGMMCLSESQLVRDLQEQSLKEATKYVRITLTEDHPRDRGGHTCSVGGPSITEISGVLGQCSSNPVSVCLYGRGSTDPQAETYLQYPVRGGPELNMCSIVPLGIVIDSTGDIYFSQGIVIVLDGAVTLLDNWKCIQNHCSSLRPAIFQCSRYGNEHLLEVHHIQRRDDHVEGLRIKLRSSVLFLRSKSLSNLRIKQGIVSTLMPPLRGSV